MGGFLSEGMRLRLRKAYVYNFNGKFFHGNILCKSNFIFNILPRATIQKYLDIRIYDLPLKIDIITPIRTLQLINTKIRFYRDILHSVAS